ncbi:MAG: hypothetical protein FGM61_12845, partial [Sediminibacterium sp.]|nr:hypothetical protein [Sediminibacterium sp.]
MLLWQSLSLVLSLLVLNQFGTKRNLILPLIILMQLIQQIYPLFHTIGWVDRPAVNAIVFAVQIGGYGWLLLPYVKNEFVSIFTTMLVILQGLLIVVMGVFPLSSIPGLFEAMHWFNSIAILLPVLSVLYQMIENPTPPLQGNSFPPIVWIACGVLFYFLTTCFIQVSKIGLPVSSLPEMMGWFEMIRIVQH